MHTRHATAADIPEIRRIAHEAWYAAYPGIISEAQIAYMLEQLYAPEVLHKNIAETTQPVLLAVKEETILGFGAYSPEETPDTYKLRKLYLNPNQKSKGIGKKILDDISLIVQQNSAKVLRLNVNRANPARYFYEKMGFVIRREEDIPFGPFVLNDYMMEKLL